MQWLIISLQDIWKGSAILGGVMSERPAFLKSGERARLFPVLAETSKEGRTLSVLLSSMAYVDEFGASLLRSIGQKVGVRTKFEVFTEVVFNDKNSGAPRPDGLIVLTVGSRQWTALVEAKIGNAQLDAAQIETYLQLARDHDVDAVITLSNQFTARPDHHPISLPKTSTRKVSLFHWSWMFVLTEATLLLSAQNVEDRDQARILSELVRFLSHPSTGVKGFERMPSSWSDVVTAVRGGAPLKKTSEEVQAVVGAWHQEVRDLCLIMSRLLEAPVDVRLSRNHRSDGKLRLRDDCQSLAETKRLRCELDIPDTANSIVVETDLLTRSVIVSMRLAAPGDRKSSQARLNWLLRQLAKTESDEVRIGAVWPGKAKATQATLSQVREDPNHLIRENSKMVLSSFDVVMVRELGGKFSGVKTFVDCLEAAVPDFYELVGQHLRAWRPSAPKLRAKTEPHEVSPAAIQSEYEAGVDVRDVQQLPAVEHSSERQ